MKIIIPGRTEDEEPVVLDVKDPDFLTQFDDAIIKRGMWIEGDTALEMSKDRAFLRGLRLNSEEVGKSIRSWVTRGILGILAVVLGAGLLKLLEEKLPWM